METVKNVFVQAIEKPERKVLIKRGVAITYDGIVPEGFDVITLPVAKYLMFKGEPFA